MERKRRDRDLMKLMMSNYKVTVPDDKNPSDFYVLFEGPKDSPYEGVKTYLILILGSLESSCIFSRWLSL